jgi:hypothetical protein
MTADRHPSQRKVPKKTGTFRKSNIKRRLAQIAGIGGSALLVGLAEEGGRHALNQASELATSGIATRGASFMALLGGGLGVAVASRSVRAIARTVFEKARSIICVMTLAAMLVGITVSAGLADALGDRFALVKIGLTPAAVEAILGPPTSRAITQAPLGVVIETMRWITPGRTYLVRMIGARKTDGARVIEKKICEGPTTC